MPVVNPQDHLMGFELRGKLGVEGYQDPGGVFGIYQVRHYGKKRVQVRERFYEPSDQSQPNKVARQVVFAAAVAAWQALSAQKKAEWEHKVGKRKMSGYNWFLRDYLNTH